MTPWQLNTEFVKAKTSPKDTEVNQSLNKTIVLSSTYMEHETP